MSRKLLESLRKLRRPEACHIAKCDQCGRCSAILQATEPCKAKIGEEELECTGSLRPTPDEPLFIQPINMAERMEFADLMAELDLVFETKGGKQALAKGQSAKTFRMAVFVCSYGVVDEQGRKQFESIEDAEKVLGDIEPAQIVFDISQRILDISGMSSGSQEAAEKN